MNLKVKELGIAGVMLLEGEVYRDGRGDFFEAFSGSNYAENGLPFLFAQDNISFSIKGTFRGLHIQKKNPQGKLIRCVDGIIMDYFLDLREDSPTFKQHSQIYLRSPEVALYVPPGIAHGFFAVTNAIVYYKCTTLHDKASDGGVRYNDPELNLYLPDKLSQISPKDLSLPTMMDYLKKTD